MEDLGLGCWTHYRVIILMAMLIPRIILLALHLCILLERPTHLHHPRLVLQIQAARLRGVRIALPCRWVPGNGFAQTLGNAVCVEAMEKWTVPLGLGQIALIVHYVVEVVNVNIAGNMMK